MVKKMTEIQKYKAKQLYDEGLRAYNNALDIRECPYDWPAKQWWRDGWLHGQWLYDMTKEKKCDE